MATEALEAEILLVDDSLAPRVEDGKDPAIGRARRRRRHWEMLWVSCAVVLLSFLLEVQPGGRVALWGLERYPLPETCGSRSLFGTSCPGCGLTRSFVHLAHGRWGEAMAVHRLGWLLAAAVLLQFPYRLWGLWREDHMPFDRRIPLWFGRLLIFALIANWLVNVAAPHVGP